MVCLGKLIKDGVLADIESIHRKTIDRQIEKKLKRDTDNTGSLAEGIIPADPDTPPYKK